ncbi:MAG: IS66 family transposase [Chloroflexi bacterium]|nr:MAG: IS66 family transposase [Chloroflexota bacterium]
MEEFGGLSREELVGIILEQRDLILALQKRIQDLESKLGGSSPSVPSWVTPNRKERREAERKKRKQSFVRKRETPTRIEEHAVSQCPDCGRALSGGTIKRVREVIETPTPVVEIVEHRYIARRCGYCGKVYTAKADLSDQVVGKHRVGINLMSLIAYLSTAGRMTKRTIQSFIKALYGVHLGLGEISEILHTVAGCGTGEMNRLLALVRGSPYINADETGWREDGLNGYIWTFSTKDVRYFIYRRSRSGEIPRETIGDKYLGVVVTDCYAGYNGVLADRQVCWAHLARDLHKLKERNPDNEAVISWANEVKSVYERAKEFRSKNAGKRRAYRILFEEEIQGLAESYAGSEAPQAVLAKRFMDHLEELFMFVEYPEVPSENNGAERALRPAVITRKVCGGTRSQKGSETKMTLMSLFGTWHVRGLDMLDSCRQLLAGRSVLFPA